MSQWTRTGTVAVVTWATGLTVVLWLLKHESLGSQWYCGSCNMKHRAHSGPVTVALCSTSSDLYYPGHCVFIFRLEIFFCGLVEINRKVKLENPMLFCS